MNTLRDISLVKCEVRRLRTDYGPQALPGHRAPGTHYDRVSKKTGAARGAAETRRIARPPAGSMTFAAWMMVTFPAGTVRLALGGGVVDVVSETHLNWQQPQRVGDVNSCLQFSAQHLEACICRKTCAAGA
jgi:hypothetical protein